MKVTKIFKRIKCEIMYRQATAKADYASKKNNGEIFYVLPTQKGNLMIMNRPLFEAFKKTKTGRQRHEGQRPLQGLCLPYQLQEQEGQAQPQAQISQMEGLNLIFFCPK